MLAADCIVDIGPGAGEHGGEVVAIGTPEEIMANPRSITGAVSVGRTQDSGAEGAQKAHRVSDDPGSAGEQSEKY